MVVSSTEFRRLGKSLVVARVGLDPLGVKTETLMTRVRPMSTLRKTGLSLFLAASLLAVPGVAQGVEAGGPDFNPPQVTRVLHRGGQVNSADGVYMEFLKKQVTVDDVLALHGQVNPPTGKAYKIDGDYFKRNWEKIYKSSGYHWPQETVVIAAQHKLGLAQDGDMGPLTRQAIQEPKKRRAVIFHRDLRPPVPTKSFHLRHSRARGVSPQAVPPAAKPKEQEEGWF